MATRLEFDWDPGKAAANLAKHRVTFEEAMTVFLDPLALSRPDVTVDEQRWVTIGLSCDTMILLVVHTHAELEDDTTYIRIVSARLPTRRERREYEQEPSTS